MGNLIIKHKMKFANLVAMAAYASAQAPDCDGSTNCAENAGEGACCAELSVAALGVEDGNYGAFSQYIWKLDEGVPITVGHTATLCVPKTYVDAHAAAVEESGSET